ncbi:MAG TPA: LamG domain-containing protein, partial [Nodosilinea sp.]|nr:LamG domain-containing protein [Nodosilinea sp.]
MVSSPTAAVPTVSLQGHFWQAKVEVVQLAHPSQNYAFRSLWLERHGPEEDLLYLPSTLILLGYVREVTVAPAASQVYRWRRNASPAPAADSAEAIRNALALGELTLLLVQANPERWRSVDPTATSRNQPLICLAGDIALGTSLKPVENATDRLYADLDVQSDETALSRRQGVTRLRSPLSVHSSGLSLYGSVSLPWQRQALGAPLQLAQSFGPSATNPAEIEPGPFRLTLETERLTPEERQGWVDAWRQLSRYLTPRNPLNGRLSNQAEAGPAWVTLEVTNPTTVPNLFWEIASWPQSPQLKFAGDSFSLIFSNQSPYAVDTPPTSLGRVSPRVSMQSAGDGSLSLRLEAGAGGAESEDYIYHYQSRALEADAPGAESATPHAAETISLKNLNLAFDPVAVPAFLRSRQGLPTPATDADTRHTPVLWGFMPLERGWFQLPVPNLTEQIYLDNGLARPSAEAGASASVIQGAVALGNDDPALLKTDYPHEQPWNLVLTNLAGLSGTWTLQPMFTADSALDEDSDPDFAGYRLSQVDLRGAAPELVFNGLFWLSTARPLAQDALPSLDNWVAGVRSHPLRTVRDTDLFPAVVEVQLTELTLQARSLPPTSPAAPNPVVAELGHWSFRYGVNPQVLGQLIQQEVLPTNTFSAYLPWVWQHHGTLPMVQAIPLTQTLVPPNYPSPNRQLIPFELAVKPITVDIDDQGKRSQVSFEVPADWLFTVNGASDWPQPAHILPSPDSDVFAPAREWQRLFDLPLVALSLPGLVLDPEARDTGLAVDTTLNLHSQYRFDLPYTDEPNALTQLPEPPQLPEALSPLPTSPRPAAPQPLGRDTFADHWQVLSQRASLASADAVVATAPGSNGATLIKSLVEPFDWPAQVNLDLTTHPGSLSLANAENTNGAALRLVGEGAMAAGQSLTIALTADTATADTALKGISGRFRQNGTTFEVVAGSLMATGGPSGLRDQRGLTRAAAAADELSNLIKTPVSLQLEPTEATPYDLTTTREPVALQAGSHRWQLWFRDLPVQVSDAAFSRQHTESDAAEDVNDPNAFSHRHNVLTGYEWRLGDPSLPQPAYLPFFNLHFYPLTLESAALAADKVQSLRLVGRLQLPLLAAGAAMADLSSDIQLTFERDASDALALVAVELAEIPDSAPVGTWPLALENGETTSAPQLTWHGIRLGPNAEGVPSLIVDRVWLNFFLFDTAWALPLAEPLVFPQSAVAEVTGRYEFPALAPAPALDPRQASLTLRFAESANQALALPHHSASLRVNIHLGQLAAGQTSRQSTFDATVDFPLLPQLGEATASPAPGVPVSLFKQLNLDISALHLNHHALEFEWQQSSNAQTGLYFLPGMPLQTADIPGFAALTFAPQMPADRSQLSQDGASYPQLMLKSAFLETMLTCQGGEFLQAAAPASSASAERIFDPSAVDLVVGYTTQLVDESDHWSESLLLNGFLEVKNLVSWPLDLQSLEEAEAQPSGGGPRTGVLIPALPEAREGYRQLNHLRHSLRVLFNQHSLPADLLTLGEAGSLFELRRDRTWQFLAVTEHQLVAVLMPNHQAINLGFDRRWTTTQTIRLMPVEAFKTFLDYGDAKTLGSSQGRTTVGQASLGLWNHALQAELLPAENPPLDEAALGPMLMVEASAPHWVRTNPVATANPTTLQFLPNGNQLAILSNPDDYGPSDPADPQWLLLTMPFWGRLQRPTPDLQTSTNPIQRDPVALLSQGDISDLALALANWAHDAAVPISLAGFDTAAGRTWARLDPLSLEESWFRLNHPLPEAQPAQLQSVLATLPSNSARLSRSTALDYAFNSLRLHYPPSTPPTGFSEPGSGEPGSGEDQSADNLLIYSERSRALRLGRGLQALYTFEGENSQGQIEDVSGVGSPLNLTIRNRQGVEWLSGGGLNIKNAALIQSNGPALKIIQACRATNELTIEAWVKAKQAKAQGPARIVTLSEDVSNRYFTLGQGKDSSQATSQYVVRLRVDRVTTNNGLLSSNQAPPLETPLNSASNELTHLVFTRDQAGVMKFYIDGQEVASSTLKNDLFPKRPNQNPGPDPDNTFRFALANELTNDRPWLGEYHLVAIYNQALTGEEVDALHQAGHAGRGQRQVSQPPYSWHQTALQLKTSGLFPTAEPMGQPTELHRHAAATVLPVRLQVEGQANPRPLSLAVSPYLGLEFQAAPVDAWAIQLASVELLCLEASSGLGAKSGLRPVASSLIDQELLSKSQTSLDEIGQQWATETHRRLTPESAIAVLRYREILSNGSQGVVTRYRFQVLALPPANTLAKPVFALRSQVRQAR